MKIMDGTGHGFEAKVCGDNRLHVDSVVRSALSEASLSDGLSFSIGTPLLSLTATGGYILWFEHSEANYFFVIHRVLVSWNGGDTNHNRVVTGALHYGKPAPTANHTSLEALNLNRGSSREADMTIYCWDEVGNGMTIAAGGVAGGYTQGGQGINVVDLEAALAIPAGVSVAVEVVPEEAGEASIIILGGFHKG